MTDRPTIQTNTGEDTGAAPKPRDLPEPSSYPTLDKWAAAAAKEVKGQDKHDEGHDGGEGKEQEGRPKANTSKKAAAPQKKERGGTATQKQAAEKKAPRDGARRSTRQAEKRKADGAEEKETKKPKSSRAK